MQSWGRVVFPPTRTVKFDGGAVDVDTIELKKPASVYQCRVGLIAFNYDTKISPSIRRLSICYSGVVTDAKERERLTKKPTTLPSDFARDLSVHHSTLSQILRGKRRLTGRNVRAFGRRLRLPAPEIAELCALENESAVLSALDRPNFQADSRWVASMVGIPLDEVNITLQRLLRKRIVTMNTRSRWERLSGGSLRTR